MDLLHPGDAPCLQPRHHQGRAATQVCGLHSGALQPLHPGDDGRLALSANLRTHFNELRHMAEPIGKQVLHKYRGAAAPCKRRHQEGLVIGGKARIGRGSHRRYSPQSAAAFQADAPAVAADLAAAFLQDAQHRCQVAIIRPVQVYTAARTGRCAQICSRHNAVRTHPMGAAVELFPSLHHHGGAAGSLDACTHGP